MRPVSARRVSTPVVDPPGRRSARCAGRSDVPGGWWTFRGAKSPRRVPAPGPSVLPQDRAGEAVFSTAADASDRAKKAASAVARVLKVDDVRGHDLRRTAATRMGEAGIPRQHIAYVLNHADGAPRATHVYDRYEHDAEKRIALETWDRVLAAILGGKPAAGAVVPFARGG